MIPWSPVTSTFALMPSPRGVADRSACPVVRIAAVDHLPVLGSYNSALDAELYLGTPLVFATILKPPVTGTVPLPSRVGG